MVTVGAGRAGGGERASAPTSGRGWNSRQTRRARWRLRQRSASRRLLPSACLRARQAAVSTSRRPLVTAKRCSAQLSWRVPPRARRGPGGGPGEAGGGGRAAGPGGVAAVGGGRVAGGSPARLG